MKISHHFLLVLFGVMLATRQQASAQQNHYFGLEYQYGFTRMDIKEKDLNSFLSTNRMQKGNGQFTLWYTREFKESRLGFGLTIFEKSVEFEEAAPSWNNNLPRRWRATAQSGFLAFPIRYNLSPLKQFPSLRAGVFVQPGLTYGAVFTASDLFRSGDKWKVNQSWSRYYPYGTSFWYGAHLQWSPQTGTHTFFLELYYQREAGAKDNDYRLHEWGLGLSFLIKTNNILED